MSFDSYFLKYVMNLQDDNVESEIYSIEKRHMYQVSDVAKLLNEECKQLSDMMETT